MAAMAIAMALARPKLRRRALNALSATPSFLTSMTMHVTLSLPPSASAASTRASAQVCGVAHDMSVSSITPSVTIEERPSLHRSTLSPLETSMLKWSACILGSLPKARVMTERLGWMRASSGVICPAATSSST